MNISFWYYVMLLLSLSFSNEREAHQPRPLTHTGSVQVYYFYDSRMPTDVSNQTMFLTENLLAKQYQSQMDNGDVIFYKVDLSSSAGQKIAAKCNIVLTGLVVARRNRIYDLTPEAYQYARSDPQKFQENLAYHIDKLLPRKKKVVVERS